MWQDYHVPGGTFRENLHNVPGKPHLTKGHPGYEYKWNKEPAEAKETAVTEAKVKETNDEEVKVEEVKTEEPKVEAEVIVAKVESEAANIIVPVTA